MIRQNQWCGFNSRKTSGKGSGGEGGTSCMRTGIVIWSSFYQDLHQSILLELPVAPVPADSPAGAVLELPGLQAVS